MKRAMWVRTMSTGLLIAVLAACSAPDTPEQTQAGVQGATGWTRPPAIDSVQRAGSTLIFVGRAEPGARVVLRSESDAAYAAAADARGRFEIRMGAPDGDLILRPETQIGQDSAPSPDRLLIIAGGRGPIALLRSGGPTRRLDSAPLLGAVDSDGYMRLASGVSPTPREALDLRAGGESGRVAPDAAGRWSLALSPSAGPDEIRVDGQTFTWPGEAAADAALETERAGAGWRVIWRGPAGATQSTWLPDGP